MLRVLSMSALGLLSVALVACSRPAPTPDPVRSVKLIRVEAQSLRSQVEYAADIRARVESRLGFRVSGKLLQRHVEVGQSVRAGQLLAVIDPQDYQLGAQAAQAQVMAAQTQRDLTASDLKRYEALRDQGFVSHADIERRQTALRAAEAALGQAQAQAGVQGNQAAYARLVADVDGVVVAVEAEVGQVLASGTPVIRLAQNGPRDAVLAVPEDRVASVKVGQDAVVNLWTQGGAGNVTFKGKVREVAAAADAATRTYTVKVALAEASVPPPLGATATVRLGAGAAAAPVPVLKLPSTAVWQQGSGSAVWVFDPASQTVKARTVQVAGLDGNEAVIAGGLQSSEEVVALGVHVLTEGQRVNRYAGAAAPAQR